MTVEHSGAQSQNRKLQPQPNGQPTADAGEELNRSTNNTVQLADSWGLLLVPIAICVLLACYAILFMR